ncbi:MAG: DUF134 domain-containing protein [Bacillota bacterium]
MGRPKKRRKVCRMPENIGFSPLDSNADEEYVIMTVDEYECIRLIDLHGYTQEECAVQMCIARGTVQHIYIEARKKIADALVNGKGLSIAGGEFHLCKKSDETCPECGAKPNEVCCKHDKK